MTCAPRTGKRTLASRRNIDGVKQDVQMLTSHLLNRAPPLDA